MNHFKINRVLAACIQTKREMSVNSQSNNTEMNSLKRDQAHQALRVRMRMVERWLEKNDGPLSGDQTDVELGKLESIFEEFCKAHVELVSAVKHNKPQEPGFDEETMETFLMNETDKFSDLKAQMHERKQKQPVIFTLTVPLATASEEHTSSNRARTIENGQTAREDNEVLSSKSQDDELKFPIRGKEGSFLTFIKSDKKDKKGNYMYKCQSCKTPQGSKPDRRKRAETEGISESRIRGHARDEHRLRVS